MRRREEKKKDNDIEKKRQGKERVHGQSKESKDRKVKLSPFCHMYINAQ